ncbi:MAG: DUF294 nucleotidyltransferase-like domain-containing protein [Hyphomicrobiaceae bacterium]
MMTAPKHLPSWSFKTAVAEVLASPGAVVGEDATLGDIASTLVRGAGQVAVQRADGTFVALVESADALDLLLRGHPPGTPLARLSLKRQTMLDGSGSVFDALVALARSGARALPVSDADGRFAGVASMDGLLVRAQSDVVELACLAASGADGMSLRAMREKQAALAERLSAAEIPADQILAALTDINNEVHRQVAQRVLAELEAEGWGRPPVAFALFTMGSGGRGENFLAPDQDNGLIIADHDERDRRAVESYFIAFAEQVTRRLADAGLPLCRGNMMATSPVWRKSMAEWRKQISLWTRLRDPVHLMNCDTLIDFKHVCGDEALSRELRTVLQQAIATAPGFVRALYSIEENHGVALDWLGRIALEKDDVGRTDLTNIKLRGTLPLLEGTRLLAVKAGVTSTSTIERLRQLGEKRIIGSDLLGDLIAAYRTIAGLLLHQQIRSVRLGREATDSIDVAALERRERKALHAAIRSVGRFRSALPSLLEQA